VLKHPRLTAAELRAAFSPEGLSLIDLPCKSSELQNGVIEIQLRKRFCYLFFVAVLFSSCAASSPLIQPQINSLAAAGKLDYALDVLKENGEGYGKNNRLLYQMDYGLLLHLDGRYKESIPVFEVAKRTWEQLYTTSLSKGAATWIINDNMAPYHGEDFERVMINIFQALNFAMMSNLEEALVEARDVDGKLSALNRLYKPDQKNVYREDAFARFLMGILYEAQGTAGDLNDAFISYAKAVEIYEEDYQAQYGLEIPRILKENMLTAAHFMGGDEYRRYKNKFGDGTHPTIEEKNNKGEIYLFQYDGLSPIKHQGFVPVPLPGGYITKLAFPQLDERTSESNPGIFEAVSRQPGGRRVFTCETQKAEPIGAIAMKNFGNRKGRVIAKAALRSAGKYVLERSQEVRVRQSYGQEPSRWFRYLSNLYNIASEEPDLRSWQTLPSEIRLARFLLDPGEYELLFNGGTLGNVHVLAGEKKFFIVRTR